MLVAYYAFVRGEDLDLPYVQSITLSAEAFDRVVVVTDSRFEDGTLNGLRILEKQLVQQGKNIKGVEYDINFDSLKPLADWKNIARKVASESLPDVQSDWLIEMEPWWIFEPSQRLRLDKHLEPLQQSAVCVALGSLNLFNGDYVKRELQDTVPCMSRAHPMLDHGGPGRLGCQLQVQGRVPVQPSVMLIDKSWRDSFDSSEAVWITNYEFYCLPTTYEAKAFWHYLKGREGGNYLGGLDDYQVDLDGQPVSMFAPIFRLPPEMYWHQVELEMKDVSIERVGIRHHPSLDSWRETQRVMVPEHKPVLRKVQKKMKNFVRRIRWRLRRGLF